MLMTNYWLTEEGWDSERCIFPSASLKHVQTLFMLWRDVFFFLSTWNQPFPLSLSCRHVVSLTRWDVIHYIVPLGDFFFLLGLNNYIKYYQTAITAEKKINGSAHIRTLKIENSKEKQENTPLKMGHSPCIAQIAHLTYSTRPLLHSTYIVHKPAYITVWCSLFKISIEVGTNGYFQNAASHQLKAVKLKLQPV